MVNKLLGLVLTAVYLPVIIPLLVVQKQINDSLKDKSYAPRNRKR